MAKTNGEELIKELEYKVDFSKFTKSTGVYITAQCLRLCIDYFKSSEQKIEKLAKENDHLKNINTLLEQDLEDRDNMLKKKVEEIYPEFVKDYDCLREELDGCYEELEALRGTNESIRAKGVWVGEGDGYADGELVYDVWHCSECNYCIDDGTDDAELLPNYCPDCGAKMKGEADGQGI